MDKIFDRFYQSGSELSRIWEPVLDYLTVNQSLNFTRDHIKVESNPGKRTCFSVMLPLNELRIG